MANVARWLAAGALLLGVASPAAAVTINLGDLSVDINDSNGRIDALRFFGTEYYNLGSPVSEYGFQRGTSTGTFTLDPGSAVIGGGTTATVTGSLGGGLSFVRTYALVPGNILRVVTTVSNAGTDPVAIRMFDTLDPDQGIPLGAGFDTINDVLAGPRGQATNIHSVMMSALPADAVIGFGDGSSPFGLGIFDGNSLNTFFASPFDPNGADSDIGITLGLERLLAAGGSATFAYDQCYGRTAEQAAAGCATGVPAPLPLALLGLGLGASVMLRQVRRGQARLG